MIRTRDQHITEEQLTEMVIDGAASADGQAHLAACAPCRERAERELAAFGSSMDAFNQASLAWSTAQPRRGTVAKTASRPFHVNFAPAALAAAAVAVAIAVPVWQHESRPVAGNSVVAYHAPDTASQIAEDNALLEQVNNALAANDASPLDGYGIAEGTGPGTKTRSIARSR